MILYYSDRDKPSLLCGNSGTDTELPVMLSECTMLYASVQWGRASAACYSRLLASLAHIFPSQTAMRWFIAYFSGVR